MSTTRRKWSATEKLHILQESDQIGPTEVCRKHHLAAALLHRWKREFHDQGMAGLQAKYRTIDPEVKALKEENERLKRIVANQALELEFKTELLKKTT